MNEDTAFILGCLHPFEGDRMVLSHVAAHIQNDIRISKIDIMVGHCTASERLSQSRYSGAVSDTGLMLDINDPQGS